MMSPFFFRNITVNILFTSVLLYGCVHESGYVRSSYNEGLGRKLTVEEQRRKELESRRQCLVEEIEKLEQEINGLNVQIRQYEKESAELQHRAEKTLKIGLQQIREREAVVERLKDEVKKKKEKLALKKRELDECLEKDV